MDELREDRLLNEIFQQSKLEINNPDFEKILLKRIRIRNSRKELIYNAILFFEVFICIDAVLFILMKINHLDIKVITSRLDSIQGESPALTHAMATIHSNHVFLFFSMTLVFLIFLLKAFDEATRNRLI